MIVGTWKKLGGCHAKRRRFQKAVLAVAGNLLARPVLLTAVTLIIRFCSSGTRCEM
jgi:hypothetical protein